MCLNIALKKELGTRLQGLDGQAQSLNFTQKETLRISTHENIMKVVSEDVKSDTMLLDGPK